MECCVNDLGRFSHNEPINTGIQTPQAGDHLLMMVAASGATFALKKNLSTGDDITFNIGDLNETMAYTFKIRLPDGTDYEENDCTTFGIQTLLNSNIDGCSNDCDDDTNNYYYHP